MVHDGGRKQVHGGQFRFDAKEWRTWANGVGPTVATAAGQKIDNVELRLTRPGMIRGRLVDKTGKPVARSALRSIAADDHEGAFHNPATSSDGDGNFELRFVRPGRHRLQGGESKKLSSPDEVSSPIVDVKEGETANIGDVAISEED